MHMNCLRIKSLICSLLTGVVVFLSGSLKSQNVVNDLDQVYGLDQTLYNGRKYDYLSPSGTTGHQFLQSILFSDGSVTIKGKCYNDLKLNFDIFNQQLVLQYADEKSFKNIIEVSKAWMKGFSIGTMNFELLSLEGDPRFYQVLGNDSLRILYFWRKTMSLNDAIGASNYVFSPALKDSYVFIHGRLRPFNNKRSLILIFDPGLRPAIKSYLRKNKVKVKKASDQEITDMIVFISKIR